MTSEAGDGYEVQQWINHQPSGVVVLAGHPQLGGRYCLHDGGDWPCAAVRAALAAARGEPPEPAGTETRCPLGGVHEHVFRGPHRFREWEPGT